MVFINTKTKQMVAKIVYYGPGLSGKTTNLEWIYKHTDPSCRREMISLETEQDRTLFFDLLPIEVGTIGGFRTNFQLYTVPGQVFYNSTRKLVLRGVDGLVFVADSQRTMMQKNLESLNNMYENLRELNYVPEEIPLVFQYNKRDLRNIANIDELNRLLNPKRFPYFEAIATRGVGVFETLKAVSKLTLAAIRRKALQHREKRQKTTIPMAQKPSDRVPAPTVTRPSPTVQAHPGGQISSSPRQPTPVTMAATATLQEAEKEKVVFAEVHNKQIEKEPIPMKKVALRSIEDIEKELNRLRASITSGGNSSPTSPRKGKKQIDRKVEKMTQELLESKSSLRNGKASQMLKQVEKVAEETIKTVQQQPRIQEIRKHIKIRLKEEDLKHTETVGLDLTLLGNQVKKHFRKVMDASLKEVEGKKSVIIILEIDVLPKK